jgi:hypothetical protein
MALRRSLVHATLFACAALAFAEYDARAAEVDDAIGQPAMQDAMHAYFVGEKDQGYFWGGVGALALSAGGYLLTRKTDFARGMAYPLMVVGVIQLAAGVVLFLRTDAQITALDTSLASSARRFRDAELERIRRVNRTFLILEIAEATLIAGGIGLAGVGASRGNDTMKGVGLGLVMQATAMLALDGVASHRAHVYQSALERFDVAVAPDQRGATIVLGGRFD